MRHAFFSLLLCLMSIARLDGQDLPKVESGSGPGAWLGVQFHDKYLGFSLGYPLVQRGGRSLGLHVGVGGYSATNSDYPYQDGLKDKTGMNLGLCVGGRIFCAAGVERLKRVDSQRVFENYHTSTIETTQVRTSGYFLMGYRSWPGLGIYVQGGGAIGIGVGMSLQF